MRKALKQILPSFYLDYPFDKVAKSSQAFQTEISQLWSKEGAEKIFRTREDFESWLNAPNPGLAGEVPIHFIKSDFKKIADLLSRILYGTLS